MRPAGLPWLSDAVLEPSVRGEWLWPDRAVGDPVPAYRWAGAPSLFTAHLPAMLDVLARICGTPAADRAALLPCLLLGGIGGHRNPLAAADACGASAAARTARPPVASAVVPDLGPGAARELGEHAQLTLMGIPAARLDVVWPAFDDYVASLTRNRRSSVRRERAALARSGCEVTVRELGACAGAIAPLIAGGLRAHGHRVDARAAAETLERLAAAAGPAALAFVVERSRRIVGACVALRHRDELHMWRIGIADGEEARAAALYFNLAYYAPIEHAMRSGARRMHLGVGSLEPKLLRGCSIEARWHAWMLAPAAPGDRARAAADLWNRIQVARLRELCDRLSPAAWPAALG